MNYDRLSGWFWDIAKYVVTAIIISTFLGGFQDKPALLYILSAITVGALVLVAIYFENKSSKK